MNDRNAGDSRIIPAEQRAQIRDTRKGGWDGPLDMERDLLDHADAMDAEVAALRAELFDAYCALDWIAERPLDPRPDGTFNHCRAALIDHARRHMDTIRAQKVRLSRFNSPTLTDSGTRKEPANTTESGDKSRYAPERDQSPRMDPNGTTAEPRRV